MTWRAPVYQTAIMTLLMVSQGTGCDEEVIGPGADASREASTWDCTYCCSSCSGKQAYK